MIPTRQQADDTIERLRALTVATIQVKNPDGTKEKIPILERIATQLLRHLDIDLRTSSRPDGYPSAGSGTSTGGRGPHVAVTHRDAADIADGDRELIPVTATEAAMFARETWVDEHRAQVEAAYMHLVEARNHIAAARVTLDTLDGTAATARLPGDVDHLCVHHLKQAGLEEERCTNPPRTVCSWCHDYRQNFGAYPGRAQLEYRHRYGKRRLPLDIIRLQFPDYQRAPSTTGG